MNGFIPVEIPTKPYIRQHLINRMGTTLKVKSDSLIGHFLLHLMQRSVDDEATDFAAIGYTTTMKLYIPGSVFKNWGANLSKTNIKHFNLFVQNLVKEEMRFYLNFYIENNHGLDESIEMVQAKMELPDDVMSYDAIKKDFYRWRQRMGKPMLKGKNAVKKCPFELLMIQQFQRTVLEKAEKKQKRYTANRKNGENNQQLLINELFGQ